MMMNKEQEKLPLPLLFRQEANESLLAFCMSLRAICLGVGL